MPDQLNIDAVLDRIDQQESGGNPLAVGKAGEIGLGQVKPEIARHYGIDPRLLFNPVVNRYVQKRYLKELLSRFNGDLTKAVEAYNAGPGRIRSGYVPAATKHYVENVLGRLPFHREASAPAAVPIHPSEMLPEALGPLSPSRNVLEIPSRLGSDTSRATLEIPSRWQPPAPFQPNITDFAHTDIGSRLLSALGPTSAYAEDVPPASTIPEGKRVDFSNGKTYMNRGGKVVEVPKPPPPMAVRAAGWLPTAGQMIGEPLGAMGGAAIPGVGETGIPEYVGAVAGGSAGSAVGAEAENAIRKAYGLPPVSVGSEAAWGGVGSALSPAIPIAGSLISRFRKAARIVQQTGKSYGAALEEAAQQEAGLESKLGIGERIARILKTAPANVVRQPYEATRAAGLQELGKEYDAVLKQFFFKPLKTNQGEIALAGSAGRHLELVGKPFRQAIEEEFAKQPKTVRGAQRLLMLVRQKMRLLNPDRDAVAISALRDIEKGLEADRNAVIGSRAAAEIENIDLHYAQQLQRFPLSRVRKAVELPQAAEEILAHKPGDEGRVLEVLDEMRRTGNIVPLQRATAARIFQKAQLGKALAPSERLDALQKAVKSLDTDVFDSLYGKGAQREWLATATDLAIRQKELLKHPDEARAIQHELQKYLESPTFLAGLMGHYAQHRAVFEGIMLASGGLAGYEGHPAGAVGAVVAVLGIEGYEMVAHSHSAMKLLRLAATQKTAKATARLIAAALSVGLRTVGESAAGAFDNASE